MKGQSNLIIAMAFISITLISTIPLYMYIYRSSLERNTRLYSPIWESMSLNTRVQSRDIIALLDPGNYTLILINHGGIDLEVNQVLIHIRCGNVSYYYTLDLPMIISSGAVEKLDLYAKNIPCLDQGKILVYIILDNGVIMPSTIVLTREIGRAIEQSGDIPTTDTRSVTIFPMRVNTTDDISNLSRIFSINKVSIYTLDDPHNPRRLVAYGDLNTGMRGGISLTYIWRPDREHVNITIAISNQVVRCVWVGYDPRNTSRYNLIITADRINVVVNNQLREFTTYTRIKIYGFTPLTPQGILRLDSTWIQEPSSDPADYVFVNKALFLNGTVNRVEIYTRSVGNGSGYDPYILLMNIDKTSGYSSILFTTVDRTYGSPLSINEGEEVLLDNSTKPLVFLYRGFNISNTEHTAVIIAVNYNFHDNEGSDEQGTEVDRDIFIVGLVDENNQILSYRSFKFRELTRYEDTYPPTAQAQSALVFIPLPPPELGSKSFYVFIAIHDPYGYTRRGSYHLDDLDFTLYIRSVEVIPVNR